MRTPSAGVGAFGPAGMTGRGPEPELVGLNVVEGEGIAGRCPDGGSFGSVRGRRPFGGGASGTRFVVVAEAPAAGGRIVGVIPVVFAGFAERAGSDPCRDDGDGASVPRRPVVGPLGAMRAKLCVVVADDGDGVVAGAFDALGLPPDAGGALGAGRPLIGPGLGDPDRAVIGVENPRGGVDRPVDELSMSSPCGGVA